MQLEVVFIIIIIFFFFLKQSGVGKQKKVYYLRAQQPCALLKPHDERVFDQQPLKILINCQFFQKKTKNTHFQARHFEYNNNAEKSIV